jgi:hypothetical protein
LFAWHEANEQYLVDRQPVATVGVVWTKENIDFYGRDDADARVGLPHRGVRDALIRARIPYLPVHADHVDRDAAPSASSGQAISLLILPNVGALSEAQCASIRRFVEGGGGLLATGESSRYDEWGDARPDFALADLFGVRASGVHHGSAGGADQSWESWARHSYLRLTPELRAGVYGPQVGTEPPVADGTGGERHPVLAGFDETDIIGFGGRLEVVRAAPGAFVPLTFVPPFPIYPPETSWMRDPTTSLPALVLNELPGGGRVAYLPADIDRCYGRDNLPDHGQLLANLTRWAARDRIPVRVDGVGVVDCHLYRQPDRLVLHLVNLSNPGAWRQALHELIPVGPFSVSVQLPEGIGGRSALLLVGNGTIETTVADGWASFEVASILDHEVVVIG